jgi:FkbM family methyltransferase
LPLDFALASLWWQPWRSLPVTSWSGFDVPVRRLDDVLIDMSAERIGLLKIDVEGWELQVLDGAQDCLRRTDLVVLEIGRDKPSSIEERLAAARLTIKGVR